MTTPTPSEADKRAAEEIVCYHVEWDMPEDRDLERAEIAKLIAAAMQPERDASAERIHTLSDIIRGRVEHSNHCHSRDPEDETCTCGLYQILKGLD